MVTNEILGNKLFLLSQEEEKHRQILVGLFTRLFPGDQIMEPTDNPIPQLMLDSDIAGKGVFEVIEASMHAELAARDYYLSMRSLFQGDTSTTKTLEYLAIMELGHYRLLEHELNNQQIGNEFDSLMQGN